MAVLELREELIRSQRSPEVAEQRVLARWSGWGSLPEVFDERSEPVEAFSRVRALLSDQEFAAAARTTLNAHYTDASLVSAVWEALSSTQPALVDGAHVLEPGCGAGTFMGLAPSGVAGMVGVELDPVTAQVASWLYPEADVRQESFTDTKLAEGSMDLVIGNVPFADVIPYDPRHNPGKLNLHNYFIAKSLRLVRPGGLVAVLTSRWTMDSISPRARGTFAESADLLSAVRLPEGTHVRAAGTDVATDLLVFRRRHEHEPPGGIRGWDSTVTFTDHQNLLEAPINELFVRDGHRVLGQLGVKVGRFGPGLVVRPLVGSGVELADAVSHRIVAQISADLAGVDTTPAILAPRGSARPRQPRRPSTRRPAVAPDQDLVLPHHVRTAEGHIHVLPEGGFGEVLDGESSPLDIPKSQRSELLALLSLRDTTLVLLEAEAATGAASPSEHLDVLRARLNQQYDSYVDRFGALNRVQTRRTGRFDPRSGEEVVSQVRPRQGGFRSDPHSPAVLALEHYDAGSGVATKADIFDERVIAPRAVRDTADSPGDAVAMSLAACGEVRLSMIAALLGQSEVEAAAAISGHAFVDPSTLEEGESGWSAGWLCRAEFLSGNVRRRLAATSAAVERLLEESDPVADPAAGLLLARFQEGEIALQSVIPADLGPTEIVVQLGVTWIPTEIVEQFLRETLDDPRLKAENPGGATWAVRGNRHSVLATNTWGTKRASAIDIVQACLEQRQVIVTDETPEGNRRANETETFAAQEKAEALQERFAQWLWEDPARSTRLVRRYNDTLNAVVLRNYETPESRDYPGMARTLRLRPHQRAAVARMTGQPSVLLAHEVGAGKTLEAIAGCMELRRMGLVRKPAVVVPNHMLEQFSREWLQAYPQARILTCGIEDLAREKRRLFVARAATGDWDAVILSRTAFEKLPVTQQTEGRYFDEQLMQLRRWLAASGDAHGLSVKRLQGRLQRLEERLKRDRDVERDPAVTFEATGIDYLCVDEAHGYKNLRLLSNIPGVAVDGAKRATDLDLKLHYLRAQHGHRVATFMTATPIANSVAEAYTMLKYLAPEELEGAGIEDFDSWAATFGRVVTDLELSASGSGFKMKSRFAKFTNVPELMRLWHHVADVKTAEDLNLPTPSLVGNQARTIVIAPSDGLKSFMADLSARADAVANRQVTPDEDNMLKISSDGRAGALDLRLLAGDTANDMMAEDVEASRSKVDAVAENVAAIYHRTSSRTFGTDPTPGTLQLIFCDLGTPTRAGWTAYDAMKDALVEMGVPETLVRYMHEATNDRAKARLFDQARNGQVAVLIGSTEKMGVGTNVQRRAVALHHVDCPWRPADLAQRDGRILRQGNLNESVEIFRYVTESSFDTYLWQTVERKAKFINQLMRGSLDVREIEDIGDSALSYAEVKALASGDPRIMELAKAETELARLSRLERAWGASQRSLQAVISHAGPLLERLATEERDLQAALPRRIDTEGDAFSITLMGVSCRRRADAPVLLQQTLGRLAPGTDTHAIGQIGELSLMARRDTWNGNELRFILTLADVPRVSVVIEASELRSLSPGLVTKVENLPRRIDRMLEQVQAETMKTESEAANARAALTDSFPRAEELLQVRQDRDRLVAALARVDDSSVPAQRAALATASRPPIPRATPDVVVHPRLSPRR